MERQIFITGASGYLGIQLTQYLMHQTDWHVIAQFRNKRPSFPSNWQHRLHLFQADIRQKEDFETIIKQHQPDTIVHLAAMARFDEGQAQPEEAIRTNFFGSLHLMQLARQNGVRKFIFTSSDLARQAKSVVGIGKLLIEYYILMQTHPSFAAMALRLPNIYNSPFTVFDIFKRQIAEGNDLTITDRRMARRFLTVDESCAFLHQLILEGKKQSVYAIDQEPLLIKDLANDMIKQSGKDLKIKYIGAKPGEKLYEDTYDEKEIAERLNKKLIRLKTEPARSDEMDALCSLLPVSPELITQIKEEFQKTN
jgi:O-antigen biosynthesis protein WbqV